MPLPDLPAPAWFLPWGFQAISLGSLWEEARPGRGWGCGAGWSVVEEKDPAVSLILKWEAKERQSQGAGKNGLTSSEGEGHSLWRTHFVLCLY